MLFYEKGMNAQSRRQCDGVITTYETRDCLHCRDEVLIEQDLGTEVQSLKMKKVRRQCSSSSEHSSESVDPGEGGGELERMVESEGFEGVDS
jgi:hypothetical protein